MAHRAEESCELQAWLHPGAWALHGCIQELGHCGSLCLSSSHLLCLLKGHSPQDLSLPITAKWPLASRRPPWSTVHVCKMGLIILDRKGFISVERDPADKEPNTARAAGPVENLIRDQHTVEVFLCL